MPRTRCINGVEATPLGVGPTDGRGPRPPVTTMTDQQASSGQPLWATDLERWALSSVNRHGIKRFVAFMTACATTVSVLLVGLAWGAIEGFDDPASW